MLRNGATLIGLLLSCAAFAQGAYLPAPVSSAPAASAPATSASAALHANYRAYAAGVPIAEMEAGFSFSPVTYQMKLGYHTTGMVGFFFRGHQFDFVQGAWRGKDAVPSHFLGQGNWRGTDRHAEIDYQQGKPVVRVLEPQNTAEREHVPDTLQANTIDTLSALAGLIRSVSYTGRCETTVRTYDGRRALEIHANTVGEEMLEPTSRSTFAGKALRCDFAGRMLAGFKFGDNRENDGKAMHGSAWLAPITTGGPPLPVRMVFETRWFGDATMYLTGIGPESDLRAAQGQ